MDGFRIRARKMTNCKKEVFSASECALSKNPTLERLGREGKRRFATLQTVLRSHILAALKAYVGRDREDATMRMSPGCNG
jgi:hypothetical protein